MRIATINGMRTPEGSGTVDFESFTFGEFQKVELTVRKDLDYFDTYDFKGYIDFCDSTPTTRIEERTQHYFSYPEGYTQEKETIDGEEISRHKVILYFSERLDYGYIDGQLLSQVDVVRNPFPDFVFFNGYDSMYAGGQTPPGVDLEDERSRDVLCILNPEFKAPNGLTKNKESQPVFYTNMPKMEYYGEDFEGGPVVSTFKTMPRIYDELQTNISFPFVVNIDASGRAEKMYYNPLEPGGGGYVWKWENLEKIEYQGNLRDIDHIFSFNLTSNTPKLSLLDKFLAYPRGGKPKTIDGAYNIENYQAEQDEYIILSDLPDTHSYYSTERLEVLLNSWNIPLNLYNYEEEQIDDPMPLGPDYSNASNLKYLECPRYKYISKDPEIAFGAKLFMWELPEGVEIVINTHNIIRPIVAGTNRSHGTIGTYSDYLAMANVKTSKKRTFGNDEQMIADPLPLTVKEVYRYFNSYFPLYKDSTSFDYPALHEGVELVQDYFAATVGKLDDVFVVPALPSTVKFISGYCSYLFSGVSRGSLKNFDNIIIQDNLCSNVEIVNNWMVSTYEESGVNLEYNTSNLIKPVPSISSTGNTYNSYERAFALSTARMTRLVSESPDGKTVQLYNQTQNRSISINNILPYLPVLNGSNHHNPYSNAFNGEYNGQAEDLGALSSLGTENVIDVRDQIFFEGTEDGPEIGGITPGELIQWWIDLGNPDPGPNPSGEIILQILNLQAKSGELFYKGQRVDLFNPSL